ncbi:cytochrome P450 [Mytilinidion resinicola]|uniref:Cytochrome P450 n=1 Tax=Mytilinidion resinicola TaxID=574789 RepID=A0A6A6YLY3_9PEZI|nr:cytochrome P450 [Mytilinidion resinicola]KAF2809791.1 cytochrome P450 [Mytilinidion resinicola]
MERIVPQGGLKADDYHVPECTAVGIPQYLAHRDRDIYGADAQDFRPERWLEADNTSLKMMDQNFLTVTHLTFQQFAKGCRGCVGRELAMIEMRTFLLKVLERFDISWAYKDLRLRTANYWMMEYFDFFVQFKEPKH